VVYFLPSNEIINKKEKPNQKEEEKNISVNQQQHLFRDHFIGGHSIAVLQQWVSAADL